jgi:hypothetical protein
VITDSASRDRGSIGIVVAYAEMTPAHRVSLEKS